MAYWFLDRMTAHNELKVLSLAVAIGIAAFLAWRPQDRNEWWVLGGYSRWVQYFIMFALGAFIGKRSGRLVRLDSGKAFSGFVMSIALLYAGYFCILGSFGMPKCVFLSRIQWVMLFPMAGIDRKSVV